MAVMYTERRLERTEQQAAGRALSTGIPILRLAAAVFYDADGLQRAIAGMLDGGLPETALGIFGSLPEGMSQLWRDVAHVVADDWPHPLHRLETTTLDELRRHVNAGAALFWVAAPSNATLDHAVRTLLAHSSHPVYGEQKSA